MNLTPALLKVLNLAAEGCTLPQSARILGRSVRTVGRQREDIIKQLGADNMVHAVAIAFHHKIIVWPELPIDCNPNLQ